MAAEPRTAAMHLSSIIRPDAIIVPLSATKRDGAITELSQALVVAGACSSAQGSDAAKLALKREKRGSTGFGHGVAVPHARLPWEHAPIAAFGIASEGIDFKALDREPVRAVFLLLTPEGQPDAHVAAMESIFAAIGNASFRRFLHQAKDAAAVMDLVTELESGAIRAG